MPSAVSRSTVADFSALLAIVTTSGKREAVHFMRRAQVAASGATIAVPVAARGSLWNWDGYPGGTSTFPSTPAVLTNASPGGLLQSSPTTGYRKVLTRVAFHANIGTWLYLVDRLSHQGGLSGTTTGAQTTNLPTAALTRRTGGAGVEAWLEIYSALGATATTATASYTDDSGTSGNTTLAVTFGGATANTRVQYVPLPLAQGDQGVRAVASVTLAATTGTAGNFGVTLACPLLALPAIFSGGSTMGAVMNLLSTGGPIDLGVNTDACLALAYAPQVFSGGAEISGSVWLVEVP